MVCFSLSACFAAGFRRHEYNPDADKRNITSGSLRRVRRKRVFEHTINLDIDAAYTDSPHDFDLELAGNVFQNKLALLTKIM